MRCDSCRVQIHSSSPTSRIIGEAVGIRYADPRDTETEETNSARNRVLQGPMLQR